MKSVSARAGAKTIDKTVLLATDFLFLQKTHATEEISALQKMWTLERQHQRHRHLLPRPERGLSYFDNKGRVQNSTLYSVGCLALCRTMSAQRCHQWLHGCEV